MSTDEVISKTGLLDNKIKVYILEEAVLRMSADEIVCRTRLLDNEFKVYISS